MIYLRKPIRFYYLVHVDVLLLFAVRDWVIRSSKPSEIVTVNKIREWLARVFDSKLRDDIEDFSFFVSWDIERNISNVTVDITGVFLDAMWIA